MEDADERFPERLDEVFREADEVLLPFPPEELLPPPEEVLPKDADLAVCFLAVDDAIYTP